METRFRLVSPSCESTRPFSLTSGIRRMLDGPFEIPRQARNDR